MMNNILEEYPLYNPSERCDNVDGPCACGAWHRPSEILTKIKENYGEEAFIRAQHNLLGLR
jgi:hypothetical protein